MIVATEILSASIVKRLIVEQGRFLRNSNELGAASSNETVS